MLTCNLTFTLLNSLFTTLLHTLNQINLQVLSFKIFNMMKSSLEHDTLASEKPADLELHFFMTQCVQFSYLVSCSWCYWYDAICHCGLS